MCAQGKTDAMQHSICAVRDDLLGAVTYKVSLLFTTVDNIVVSQSIQKVLGISQQTM